MAIYEFQSKLSTLQRYFLAIGIFLTALILRFLLIPIDSGFAFLTFYPATVIGFYLCGKAPGTVLTLLSSLSAYYFFIPPSFTFSSAPEGIIAVLIYLSAAYMISQIVEQLKTAINTLKFSEHHYVTILEDQSEFICRFKADGTILYVNDAFCRIFNRPKSVLIGSKWQPNAYHDDLNMINEKLSTLSPSNAVVTIENRFNSPGLGIRWGQFINRAFFNGKGELIEMQAVGRDITDQKLAQEEILKLKNLLQSVIEGTSDAIFVKDIKGRYTLLNNAAANFVGKKQSEIIGTNDNHLFPEHEAQLIMADDLSVLASGKLKRYEETLPAANGEKRALLVTKGPLFNINGTIDGIFGITHDITERKRTEKELLKLAAALDQSPVSIVITNANAEIEYVNDAFERSSGYSREEVTGQNPRFLKSGKTPIQTYVNLWSSLTQGQCWEGEFINKRKNGSEYIEFAKISPLYDESGHITHFVEVKEDISEKKLMASELEQHRYNLEKLVTDRTVELETALHLADSANRAKSLFLANMSHEIRTPMNAIIGLTYLLQKSVLTAEQARKLQLIDTSANHLLSIINNILDLSKIEAHRVELEQTDFKLESVFEYARSLILASNQNKDLSIEISYTGVPPLLHGDLTRLRQALVNYAVNAAKFTEQGTIWMRAKLLEDTDKGLLVRFEVEDTGVGIPEEVLPTLFQAFTQADVSTTRQYGGTGLGLVITQRLANLMGGTAGVESKLGAGSLFWFTARLSRGQGNVKNETINNLSEAEMKLRQKHAGARLLLVEDNPINREVALELLTAVGLIVDTAEDGLKALEKIYNQSYNLVLMDVQIPKIDGLEITKRIRSEPAFEKLPILAMTASVLDGQKNACFAAGMSDFVAKPVVPETLYSTVYRWLSRSE